MSVLRAALMGGLAVIAVGLGRRGTGLISLAAACWVLALINPLYLWDVGFQLSAAATAGLILFTPLLAGGAAHLWPGWMGGPLSSPYRTATSGEGDARCAPGIVHGLFEDSVVVSLAATIAVTPLILHTFGRVSGVGMLANLLIVPIQPLITVAGSAGALAGALGANLLAQLLLWAAWPGLFWTVEVVKVRVPFALRQRGSCWIRNGRHDRNLFGDGGAPIATADHRFVLRSQHNSAVGMRQYRPTTCSTFVAGMVTLLVWWAVVQQPDRRLHMYFLDVGQGDGMLIETPGGRQTLIDGGSSPQALLSELGAVMPFWDRSLDLVVLTHADGDHMDAQTQHSVASTSAKQSLRRQYSTPRCPCPGYQHVERTHAPVSAQHSGGWINLGDAVVLWVINPNEGATSNQTQTMRTLLC